jgi:hypothetical protein
MKAVQQHGLLVRSRQSRLLFGGSQRQSTPQNSMRAANWKARGPPDPKNPPAVLKGD